MDILNNKQILKITDKIFKVERMKDALCNDVYFIKAKKGEFIIKIAKGKIRQEELDKEFNLIAELKECINLPKIYLYQKEQDYSFFVMEYIEGNKPTNYIDETLKDMAITLKTIHNLRTTEFVDFDKLIEIAEWNMNNNKLDLSEFMKNNKAFEPKYILTYLKENKPKVKGCLLHGDYRPKNMIVSNSDLYILDWGLSFVGDPYYDFAIIKWYFTDEEFVKFMRYYGIDCIDEERIKYNEWLSAFLNV